MNIVIFWFKFEFWSKLKVLIDGIFFIVVLINEIESLKCFLLNFGEVLICDSCFVVINF